MPNLELTFDTGSNYITGSLTVIESGSVSTLVDRKRYLVNFYDSGSAIRVNNFAIGVRQWTLLAWVYTPTVPAYKTSFACATINGISRFFWFDWPQNQWALISFQKISTSNYIVESRVNGILDSQFDQAAYGTGSIILGGNSSAVPETTHPIKVDYLVGFDRLLSIGEIYGFVNKNYTGSFDPTLYVNFDDQSFFNSGSGGNPVQSAEVYTGVGTHSYDDGYYPTTTYSTGSVYNATGLTTIFSTYTGLSSSLFSGSINDLYYQISTDGTLWNYWNGSSWVSASSIDLNTEGEVNSNIESYNTYLNKTLYVKTILSSSDASSVIIDTITIPYNATTKNVFTNVKIK
jgi:hypothetical protein